MKTFFNILQTLGNIKDKKYPNDPFTITPAEEINEINMAIHSLVDNIFYMSDKRRSFYFYTYAKIFCLSVTLNNIFYKKELKEKILDIFSNAQKHYYAFSKLALIYKIKKYNTIVSEDLSMNTLDPNNKHTFILIENKCKYLFSLNDLISIIENAIGNAPDFFAEPLSPCNPYNKRYLTLSTLYNIYFRMKSSGRLISFLFHLFFLENFNKDTFCEKYEEYIREKAIKQFIFNMPYTTIYPYVIYMIENNKYTNNYSIHPDFPKDLLVSIFRPYLYYYFVIKYTMRGTNNHSNYKKILDSKLMQFYKYNTTFGRKHIQITRIFGELIKIEYRFNIKHINFYGIQSINSYTANSIYNQPIETLTNLISDDVIIDNPLQLRENINGLNLNFDPELDLETESEQSVETYFDEGDSVS